MITYNRSLISALLMILSATPSPAGSALEWQHTFTGATLDVQPVEGEEKTEVQQTFLTTGQNRYLSDLDAIEDGAGLFLEKCAICHGLEARGRMGPSLVDDIWVYEKNRADKGMFETIWGGAAAAMTPFRGVLTQDQILRVMAYVRSLPHK